MKIVKKHETPTRVGGVLGGGVGLATGLVIALVPGGRHRAAASCLATGGGGATPRAHVAGHAAAGMSRSRSQGPGRKPRRAVRPGLVVVAVSDMEAKVKSAMKRAEKIEEKQLKADQKEPSRTDAKAEAH